LNPAIVERAIDDCRRVGTALLKFLSTNDVPRPRSHQFGVYLPKHVWQLFTPHPPERGDNQKSWPTIIWPDGLETESCVTWYGRKKQEYRLTRFGRGFPHLTTDQIGSLFVLIPESHDRFIAYVFDYEDEIDGVFAGLGVEVVQGWGCVFDATSTEPETQEDCLSRQFAQFCRDLTEFPSTAEISTAAQAAVQSCDLRFASLSRDDQLMAFVQAEYDLFRLVERLICGNQIQGRLFRTIDEFLDIALTVLNRRKVRAGRALENHFEYLLREAELSFDIRSQIKGRPDVILPSIEAYYDSDFPAEQLIAIGIKTTCKDRWRQILPEAERAGCRFLVTLQQGISTKQLDEMTDAGVTVVVPRSLHDAFARSDRARLMTVEELFEVIIDIQS